MTKKSKGIPYRLVRCPDCHQISLAREEEPFTWCEACQIHITDTDLDPTDEDLVYTYATE